MKRAALWFVLGLLGACSFTSASTVSRSALASTKNASTGIRASTTSAFQRSGTMLHERDECPTGYCFDGGCALKPCVDLRKTFERPTSTAAGGYCKGVHGQSALRQVDRLHVEGLRRWGMLTAELYRPGAQRVEDRRRLRRRLREVHGRYVVQDSE